MNDDKLSPSVRGFVDEALELEPGLDDGARQRVRARVLKAASVAVSAGSVVGLHASAAASGGGAAIAGVASTSVVTKVATGLVALGLVAGGAAAGWRARPVVVSSARVVTTSTTRELSPTLAAAEPQRNSAALAADPSDNLERDQPPHASDRGRPIASPIGQTPAATPSASSFPEELAALERVRLAVATGDPRRALRELAASDHVGSTGTFTEEREALRVVALCGIGRETDGLRALVAFRAAFPRSMQIARIERACSKVVTDPASGGHSPR